MQVTQIVVRNFKDLCQWSLYIRRQPVEQSYSVTYNLIELILTHLVSYILLCPVVAINVSTRFELYVTV